MLSYLAVGPINHVLRGESWARRRLQPHAGRTARFDLLPFSAAFTIREDGELAPALPEVDPNAVFRLTPPIALRILAGDQAAYHEVRVSGDGELAQAVQFVVRNARWDAEEDLSRLFGDAAAHRLAAASRAALRMPAHFADKLTRNLADYWVEERPLIARRTDVDTFVRDVDRLRDEVERMAARIAQLSTP